MPEIFPLNSLSVHWKQAERKTSDIFISDEFRHILEKFSDKSEIASTILHRRIDKDILAEDHVNYIGVSILDKSKISYLSPERILKIEQSSTDDYWTSSMRFAGKPGAFINKLFKLGYFPQTELEKFATLYKTFSNPVNFEFKVVTGDDIRKYYYGGCYESQSGSLGNSCMKSSGTQDFFKIYIDHPEVISMLVMLNLSGQLIGRALLWHGTDKVMDRVYTVSDEEYQAHFFKWAIDNGYSHKTHQNCYKTLHFTGENDDLKRIDIKLNNWHYSRYPYLDTFKWLDRVSGVLTNYKPDHFNENCMDHRVLVSPSGGSESANFLAFDQVSNDYCFPCDINPVVTDDGETIYTNNRNCVWSDIVESYILVTESEYCEQLESHIYKRYDRNPIEKVANRIKVIEKYREKTVVCPIRTYYSL